MGRRSTYQAAIDLDDKDLSVELIGVLDTSDEAEACRDRIEKLVAKIILLGQTRGRPRKEIEYEEQNAA